MSNLELAIISIAFEAYSTPLGKWVRTTTAKDVREARRLARLALFAHWTPRMSSVTLWPDVAVGSNTALVTHFDDNGSSRSPLLGPNSGSTGTERQQALENEV